MRKIFFKDFNMGYMCFYYGMYNTITNLQPSGCAKCQGEGFL